jgi:hypothetical protein
MTAAYDMWLEKMNVLEDPLAEMHDLKTSMWERITSAAEAHNVPGSFTALIGFEWTLHPNGNNLHRNLIFRDGKDKADPIRFDEIITGRFADDPGQKQTAAMTSAAGIAAVWARDNTREAIWDALARKEVYATTGTRTRARVFGGFEFDPEDLDRSDFAAHGYAKGVPMGGDLGPATHGQAPGFLIRAIRDPDGANLDRVQVVKGWLDAKGEMHERIYDVAASDGRTIGADGRCKTPVGSTVNIKEATYTNAIGAPFFQSFWRDPDFDPSERAFYYIRVLEIPTPRWTTYDAKFFGVKRPDDIPASIQERAYTSPIWYKPTN